MRLLSFQLKLELLWFVASFCMQHAWLDRLKALTQMHRATQAHRDTLAHTGTLGKDNYVSWSASYDPEKVAKT